tara:strand:+ start:35 stop:2107 length:2073 start_codon:yes stop_codon:yes gene_type:complete
MAINYLDSKRIVKLSSDIVQTVTYETDFSSNTGWTATGSNVVIDTSASYRVMDFNIPNSTNAVDAISYDLTSTSDSAWVLRFKLTMTNFSTNSTGHAKKVCIGLSSASHSTAIESSQDAIGILFGSWSSGTKIRSRDSDGGSWMDGSGTDFAETFVDDEVYYVEIKRTSTTAYTVSLYNDSTYSTLIEAESETMASTVSGLRYIKVGVDTTTSAPDGTFAGQIDDMKFYNGVSSLSNKPTNVQDNSILVEKDTANRYWGSNSTVKVSDIEDKTLVANGSGIGYSGAYIDINIPNFASYTGDYRLRTLDTTITTTDFVLDFDWWRQGSNNPPNTSAGLVLRSSQSGLSIENSGITSDDYIRTNANDAGTTLEFLWHSAGTSTETSIGTIAVGSIQAWKYMRLTRTDATTLKFEQFSSEARTGSATLTVNYTSLPSSWGLGLKYIGGYCSDANAGGGLHERLQNIDLSSTSNGTLTTWTMNPTYETDFTTNTGWVSNASNVVVNTSTKKLTFAWTAGTPNQQIYYDLGSVSDTAFVLRYVVNFSTLTSASEHLPVFSIKLSGSNSSAEYPPAASQIAMQLSAGTGSDNVYFKSYNTSGGGDPQPTAISWNPTIGTDYYVEMIRNSATLGTLNVRTGSHTGTMVTNFPMTASPLDSGCTGLRYIRLQQYPNSFGNITGTMDDIKFYNGVTTPN